MRSLFFFLLIVALLGGGGYYLLNKTSGDSSSDKSEKGEIAPVSDWKNILPGKWEFKTEYRNSKDITIFSGEITYLPDGTFERHVSIKVYVHKYDGADVEENEEELCIKAGGVVKGKWKILETGNGWDEESTYCNISQTYTGYHNCNQKYNGCGWFPLNTNIKYGDNSDDFSTTELKLFTKEKILITGKDFSVDGTRKYTSEKMD